MGGIESLANDHAIEFCGSDASIPCAQVYPGSLCSRPMSQRIRILFLCTGNTARSLMAEAIANHEFAEKLHACSAGSQPKAQPHPLTLQTLQKYGVSTDRLRSKSWDEFKDQSFDLVITLCDVAGQASCPEFPGEPRRAHWSLPDPAEAPDTPQSMFEVIYDALVEAIGLLVYGPNPDLPARAAEAGRQLTRRFAPRAI